MELASSVFGRGTEAKKMEDFETVELYEEIGRLKMELDWGKKTAQFVSDKHHKK